MKLELHESIKALIFDCDGTILNSEPLHAKALSATLASIGLKISEEEIITKFRGSHDSQVYNALFNTNSGISKEAFLRTKTQKLLEQLALTPVHKLKSDMTPGFLEAFAALSSHYPIAVVSSSEKAFLDELFKKLDLFHKINFIVHGDVTIHPKPSPAPYIHALKILELEPEEVVIFEDSIPGLLSAISSGAEVVWVTAHLDDDKTKEQLKDRRFHDIPQCENFYWLKN